VLEAERLRQRTTFDLEMMRELGFCSGIENYSRHLARREAGSRPWTLLDYFPPDWLLVVDESHMSIPQVSGMYKNDRTRKEILVDFGFRLPSALDNRPLTFEEFDQRVGQRIYVSATPGPFELERTGGVVVEQLIRPTGLLDPEITIRPARGQVDDLALCPAPIQRRDNEHNSGRPAHVAGTTLDDGTRCLSGVMATARPVKIQNSTFPAMLPLNRENAVVATTSDRRSGDPNAPRNARISHVTREPRPTSPSSEVTSTNRLCGYRSSAPVAANPPNPEPKRGALVNI